ncbi:MAG: hybrid sensor histidine kinase/response regulator [Thermodesulfobacteriota bacterium]|nr:hybrid sensor histidine kinase/response regulator [Thermodesulfobacteriota bacterium]
MSKYLKLKDRGHVFTNLNMKKPIKKNSISTILVIDDQIDNLELALTNLEMEGYTVITSSDGKEGLKKALSELPDLIVLDIMMPGMDGWEVCHRLKNYKKTEDIPVLMLTARTDLENIVKGLELGASEYLSKPFHVEEFIARVKTLVRMKKAEDSLRVMNKNLERLVEDRTNKLLEASRSEVLGNMAGAIGHDLANLLTSIRGRNELALMKNNIPEIKEYLKAQTITIDLMANFVANLRQFAGEQKPVKTVFDPLPVVKNNLKIMERQLKANTIITKVHCPEKVYIMGDKGQFAQICLNLIVNAKDAMEKGGSLIISMKRDDSFIVVRFKDTGCGIPRENLNKIFDLLFTTKPDGKGTGIGLFTMKEIVKEHGGRIEVESTEGKGTTFSFWLPAG